ncbi:MULTISPECIES: hypothetical protein [unclassified Thiocapsa]
MAALLPGATLSAETTGAVRIFTIPGDAQLFVDGERKATAPSTRQETF